MPLSPGTKLGPYEILSPIGAGGMGEVYQAKDTRLDRTVAIKVLPSELAESAERKARAISQLNHPHICTLYDVGEEDGVDFIVMEYLEGETLAEILKRGPLPLDKALEYGIQIADGLDAAHRARVVHRDLKPPQHHHYPIGGEDSRLRAGTTREPSYFLVAWGPCFEFPRPVANRSRPRASIRSSKRQSIGPLLFCRMGVAFSTSARRSNQAHTGIFVGSLDSVETKHFVTGADSSALYTPPGFLVFMREGNLFAQEFDADRLELRGEPVIVAQDIAASGGTMAVSTVSATGVLAYRGVGPTHRMVRSLGQGTWCRLRARYLRECGSFER